MITKLLALLLGPWGKLLGVGVVLAFVWGNGWYVANRACQARIDKQAEEQLERNEQAARNDRTQLAKDALIVQRLTEEAERLRNELANGDNVCFDSPDVDGLRQLWR